MTNDKLIQWCGIACVVGSATFSAVNLMEVFDPSLGPRGVVLDVSQFRLYVLALGLVVMPGFLAGQFGFHRLGAAGGRLFSKIILIVSGIGCAAFSAGALYSAVTLRDPAIHGIGIVLNMLLAPILWFVAAMRARRVTKWKRVWPLVMGLIPWLMFWVAVPLGFPRFGAPAVVGVFWLVFAYAVFSEARFERDSGNSACDAAMA